MPRLSAGASHRSQLLEVGSKVELIMEQGQIVKLEPKIPAGRAEVVMRIMTLS